MAELYEFFAAQPWWMLVIYAFAVFVALCTLKDAIWPDDEDPL